MKEPKKKKSNAGRKKFIIDWKRVDRSLICGANGVQVAAMLGIHYNTLVNKCQEEKKCDLVNICNKRDRKAMKSYFKSSTNLQNKATK